MLSFRPKIGVWSALMALTLQLALSFGHVHFNGAANSHCGTAITGTIANVAQVSKIPPPVPADSTGEYCTICASIQLADGCLAQALFQLPSFILDRTTEPAGYDSILISTPRRILFQSRAPPLL